MWENQELEELDVFNFFLLPLEIFHPKHKELVQELIEMLDIDTVGKSGTKWINILNFFVSTVEILN